MDTGQTISLLTILIAALLAVLGYFYYRLQRLELAVSNLTAGMTVVLDSLNKTAVALSNYASWAKEQAEKEKKASESDSITEIYKNS